MTYKMYPTDRQELDIHLAFKASASSSSLLLSSLELSDTKVYEPQIRARLGTTAYKMYPTDRQELDIHLAFKASASSSSLLLSSLELSDTKVYEP